jgi:hypothetical protein
MFCRSSFWYRRAGDLSLSHDNFSEKSGHLLDRMQRDRSTDQALPNLVVKEDESKRENGWRRWEHLKRDLDWGRLWIAAIIGSIAVLIYALARGLAP